MPFRAVVGTLKVYRVCKIKPEMPPTRYPDMLAIYILLVEI